MDDSVRREINNDPQLIADLQFLRGVAQRAAVRSSHSAGDSVPGPVPSAERVRAIFGTALKRSRKRRMQRRLASAGGCLLAAAVLGLLLNVHPSGDPAFATPSMLAITPVAATVSTSGSLVRIAATAQKDGRALGEVDHLIIDRWDLNSTVGARNVTSQVVASRRQLWRNRTGEARTVDESPVGSTRPADNYYPAGTFPSAFAGRPPLDSALLATWLRRSDTSDVAIVNGVADLLAERALTGVERAAVLRVLSDYTRLVDIGETRDRAGRPGLVFATRSNSSGAEITHLFVIDPVTANFLAYEQILDAGGDALHVQVPAVVAYRTYVSSGFVDRLP